jgi:hypothetical protein
MSQMMPDMDDGQTELADKHDGATISRERVSGTFEYEVVLTPEQCDELPSHMSADEFAANVARSRAEKELDPTHALHPSDVMAKEQTVQSIDGDRRFDVWVRFGQND